MASNATVKQASNDAAHLHEHRPWSCLRMRRPVAWKRDWLRKSLDCDDEPLFGFVFDIDSNMEFALNEAFWLQAKFEEKKHTQNIDLSWLRDCAALS